ncbi:MAG TPA: UDP-3-O-acyl-N-acetylglucosamine deacetylase [Thermodesulfovibrionales bacterium]|nr:UDP-3-O-acyl-N-acetylglucosamine deacetylase [Thermodesulfovibrionales bacterium]
MRLQRTLKQEVTFDGIGLHTGRHATVTLKPAPRDTGIIFHRLDRAMVVRAHIGAVTDTSFATTLGNGVVKIKTVEHILAVLAGLGIDNVIVEVDGPEIPILDGSSTELVSVILKAGIAKQGKKRPYMRITKPLTMDDGHSEVAILPYDGRKITYRIHFNHHMLGEQHMGVDLNEESFIKEIAPARTFGFLKDVEYMMAQGLAKGGSLNNAIILTDKGVINSSGLRFKDEFVRHKILDLIGDFSLIGFPIYGHVFANKSGHSTNLKFMKKLLTCPECWEIVSESVTSEIEPSPALLYL